MNNRFNLFIIFVLQALFFACKTNDKVIHPEVPIPDSFRHAEVRSDDSSSIAAIPWRDFFSDPTLQLLIDTAIVHNMDLQLAIKNITAAQATLKQAKAGYIPNVDLQVGANSSNPSNNSLNGISLNQFLGTNHIEDYTAALALSWEADIWGKIKNQKAEALATYLQTEEAKKAVQTQIVSYIAQGYYNLLMLHEQLKIARQNLALNDSTLNIIKEQYEVGDITRLGLEQAEAQRLAAASLIPDFEQQINIQENALSVLSGKLPAAIATKSGLDDIRIPEKINSGVPSLLLSRRPDVKRAELAVAAALANQRYTRANMYPSLVISAQAGVNSFKASNWFNIPASVFGTVAGGITQPILQRRQLKTNYELATIDYEKNVIQFRQSVITAVGEVSDALIALNKLKQKQSIALDRTKKLQSAIHNADLLFNTGMANYLEVITAQSNVLQSELELAQIKKAQLVAVVDLYRSLGGGW
ncbi:efflux transporter outer membrane subunit [Olivibacter sp. XZL3]|uniref:efflux transporter outer membrane subunit n=1 Tax=Olivibacter sp. XZL3 TaxID=1735116 RepID=UPI001065507B|nr:TolC family protein [Olivibacter sp. XZL3]